MVTGSQTTTAPTAHAERHTPLSLVALVGNPRPASRTYRLALAVAEAIGSVVPGADVQPIDLAAIPASAQSPKDGWSRQLDQVRAARLLVVATPTYKASYTGLLKLFLDQFGGGELASVIAVPVTVAAAPGHLHAGETHLRPLLLEIGAQVPVPALAVLESQLDPPDAVVAGWLATAGPTLAALLGARP